MSEQTKISQAENALEAVQHAVDQAESHPSDQKIEEAERAMRHTQASVQQAQDAGGDRADQLQQQVRQERAELGGTNE
ncbi:hypothetical protein SD71_21135 [Cohnella kolymensis]|uniref:Uncharacterized protein n=1 Tax=Cohnella kolymensis TaxID=1590652 RepID=A0ABR4ZZC8_9BACL|nr:hypothetical protein [Cohnella kolymensis]KIL34174.1 hypothetical protein SD71_21135 [Cohnella kolymensis]